MKKSKIFGLMIMLVSVFLFTGCGTQDSAEGVAKQVVKYLSTGNESKVVDLFYHEDSTYFDEEAFAKVLESKELIIKDNKKISVREVGAEITDENGNTTVKVQLDIDDYKIFTVNTIQVDGKWYVYDDSFFDKDIRIVVAKDAKVSINGNKLNSKDMGKIKMTYKATHPDLSTYYNVRLDDIETNAYILKKPVKGTYAITVEGGSTIKDEIYTYSKYSSSSSKNYTSSSDSTDGTTYVFEIEANQKDAEKFVTEYTNAIYSNAISTKSFDGVQKYFASLDEETLESVKKYYSKMIEYFGDKAATKGYNYYYDKPVISELSVKSVNAVNDEIITVAFSYKLSIDRYVRYSAKDKYTSTAKSYEIKSIFALKKKGNSYEIIDYYNPFNYYFY